MAKPKTRVTTPEATLSFPQLFAAKAANDGDDPKFSATVIFDEGQDMSTIDAAIEAAIERGVAKKWGGKRPAKLVLPYKDGNEKTDADDNPRPEFEGRTYITVSASEDEPPVLVDAERQPIINKSDIYGGARVRVAVSAYPWTYGNKKGVSLYLKSVQVVGEGTPFGVSVSVDDDFA